eukprot:CAMPEP_0185028716 /NCGR_PEP_ID=MMETSP1103-20130426/14654_1 /TAXON_ID=36769 /ORGANISM="Paraphysomonas bandaiensis, Strain Caron Lab Isolate" /LENGTH=322 /DNA_ID=CAMNT_0027563225 /DNA_START=110 /DNA_END=1078 /DNA_ORIENTATION=-
MKALCSRGIPDAVRGQAWLMLAGNSLHITPALYEIFQSRSSSNPSTTTDTYTPDAVSTESKSLSREDSIALIQHDVPRTFAKYSLFSLDTRLTESLERVLRTYACYRPDVGYVQGMSYVAGMCLLYLDEYSAFQAFANILGRRINFDFYRLKPELMSPYVETFNYFFSRHLPGLRHHMIEEGVASEVFLLDWNLSLFAKAAPVPVATRLWDSYMVEGEVFVVRAALGILQMFEFKLQSSTMEGIIKLLSHLPDNTDPDKLMGYISGVSISEQTYQRVRDSFTEKDTHIKRPPRIEGEKEESDCNDSLQNFFVHLLCPSFGIT